MRGLVRAALAAVVLCTAACGTQRESIADRRAFAQITRDAAVADLEELIPGTRERLDAAPGWAVFSTIGAKTFLDGDDGGIGVLHDGATGAETAMRMSEPSLGRGIPLEQFRAVFVFHDPATVQAFKAKGWKFDAAQPPDGIEVYRLADGAVAPDPALAGTKYWPEK